MYKKVWLEALAKAALIAIVLAPATPRTVSAQDCGTNCGGCGTGKKEGYDYHARGQYNMNCQDAITGCASCPGGGGSEMLVKDAAQAPGALLSTLRSVSLESLRQMAPTLRDRLVVHPTRNIVAVRGAACQSKSVVALAFLSRERMEILSRSGLPGLEDFLNQAVSQAK